MALVEAAIFSILSNAAGLTALVGSRIYPVSMPMGTALPAVTYQRISGPRVHAMGADPGLQYPRIQVSSRSDDAEEVKNVAEEVRLALQNYSGTVAGVVIQKAILDTDRDLPYDPATKSWGFAADFIVWAEE